MFLVLVFHVARIGYINVVVWLCYVAKFAHIVCFNLLIYVIKRGYINCLIWLIYVAKFGYTFSQLLVLCCQIWLHTACLSRGQFWLHDLSCLANLCSQFVLLYSLSFLINLHSQIGLHVCSGLAVSFSPNWLHDLLVWQSYVTTLCQMDYMVLQICETTFGYRTCLVWRICVASFRYIFVLVLLIYVICCYICVLVWSIYPASIGYIFVLVLLVYVAKFGYIMFLSWTFGQQDQNKHVAQFGYED